MYSLFDRQVFDFEKKSEIIKANIELRTTHILTAICNSTCQRAVNLFQFFRTKYLLNQRTLVTMLLSLSLSMFYCRDYHTDKAGFRCLFLPTKQFFSFKNSKKVSKDLCKENTIIRNLLFIVILRQCYFKTKKENLTFDFTKTLVHFDFL